MADLDPTVAARVLAATGDIALVLDRKGVVREASADNPDLRPLNIEAWIGEPFVDSVTSESRPKVADMLKRADDGEARWREINHPASDGGTTLIRYLAVAGQGGARIVVGRSLADTAALQQRLVQAQQSVERDYLRLRQAESRYRLLFQTSSEAVLIVDAVNRRIREANPAARKLIGDDGVEGQPFAKVLASTSVEDALRTLTAAELTPGGAPVAVTLAGGAECDLAASLFRQDQATRLLVRLTPRRAASDAGPQLSAVLERIPDAFVVTDPELRILTVNPAFLDLAQLGAREQAVGESLERYLGRPGVDARLMLSQLREHGAMRNFATVLRGGFGGSEEVEVSAVAALDVAPPTFGFSIRAVGGRIAAPSVNAGAPPRSIEQMAQLIGRVPMKEIVRESSDLIERLCVEAALKLTRNNRAAAADLLGLSRQSLYVKLARYGITAPDDTPPPPS